MKSKFALLAMAGVLTVLSAGCSPSSSTADTGGTNPPVISTTQAQVTAAPATEGTPYSFTFQVTGGIAPYSWSAPSFPEDGLSFNLSTGALSGTPTANGTLTFALLVTDSTGRESAASNFNLTINRPSSATTAAEVRSQTSGALIETIAGSGVAGFAGDGGAAVAAALNEPTGLAFDASGNLYVADTDNNRIRRIALGGTITTVAGNGTAGYTGDGGPARAAALNQPRAVAVDAAGDLYISDSGNERIRYVSAASGTISTLAGTGATGMAGDGGPAAAAQLFDPAGLRLDGAGNLYIADEGNNALRRIGPDGRISTLATQLNRPADVVLDAQGDIYIAEVGGNRVMERTPTGTLTTVAGTGAAGYSGDGGKALAAQLNRPAALALDSSGTLYIADLGNNCVRAVADGTIVTVAGDGTGGFAGDGGPAAASLLWAPAGLATSAGGELYIADTLNNRIRALLGQ